MKQTDRLRVFGDNCGGTGSMASMALAFSFFALSICGCGPPHNPWSDGMSRAKRNSLPFVVEFTAVWCKPCETFERDVLSRPDVKKELERVEFVRLDYDSEVGRRQARRLGIDGIPTVALIGANGQLEGGLRGAASAQRFMRFLEWAQTEHQNGPPGAQPSPYR